MRDACSTICATIQPSDALAGTLSAPAPTARARGWSRTPRPPPTTDGRVTPTVDRRGGCYAIPRHWRSARRTSCSGSARRFRSYDTPEMGQRVDRPGDVPDQHRPDEHAPDQQTGTELHRLAWRATAQNGCDEAAEEEHHPGPEQDRRGTTAYAPCGDRTGRAGCPWHTGHRFPAGPDRGFSTSIQPTWPQKKFTSGLCGSSRRSDCSWCLPMHRDPPRRGVLHAADRQDGEPVLQPFRADQAAMRQQPMIAQIDPEAAEHVKPQHRQHETGPAEQPGQHRQRRDQVVQPHRHRI